MFEVIVLSGAARIIMDIPGCLKSFSMSTSGTTCTFGQIDAAKAEVCLNW